MNTKNKFLLMAASLALTCGTSWGGHGGQSGTITFQIQNTGGGQYRSSLTFSNAIGFDDGSDTSSAWLRAGAESHSASGSLWVSEIISIDAFYSEDQTELLSKLESVVAQLTNIEATDGSTFKAGFNEGYASFYASDLSEDSINSYNGTVTVVGDGTIDQNDYETYEIALSAGGTLRIILSGLQGLSVLDKSNLETMVQSNQVYVMRGVSNTLNGSHHRLLMDSSLNKDGWHTWVTGDFAGDQATNSAFASGEVGASRSVGSDDVRVGLGIGHMNASADGMFGSTSNLKGQYLVGEVDYRVREDVILSALAYYGASRATSHRNAADASYTADGKTDVSSFAGRLRADWKNAFQAGDVSFTPRAAYTYIGSTVDAYTETGAGANNVSLEKQDRSAHEFRAGLDADYLLNEKTLLRGILEVAHLNGDNETVRGSTDSDSFTLPADDSASKDTWARLGIEAVRQVSDSANIHASIFRSTEGYDATVSGAIGMNFWF